MSRSLRRGAVAAVIIATAPILAACSAGDNAASLQVAPNNAATSIANGDSSLKLNEIVVVTGPIGLAPAGVTVNIANIGTKADTLTAVSVNGVPATLSGDVRIPAQGSVLLGAPGKPSAVVPTLDTKVGANATVAFTFETAGSVQTQALVTTATGEFASYGPSPTPTPTPTPAATATATGTATATATPTDTQTP